MRKRESVPDIWRAVQLLTPQGRLRGRRPLRSAIVDPSASVEATVSVGAFAVIGAGARVGDRTVIHAHAVVGPAARRRYDCMSMHV